MLCSPISFIFKNAFPFHVAKTRFIGNPGASVQTQKLLTQYNLRKLMIGTSEKHN